jgi:hypothetical protein
MPGISSISNTLQVAPEEEQATLTKAKDIEASVLKNVVSSPKASLTEMSLPPTAAQCAVHLMLLETIICLKSKVEQWGASKALDSETSWQYYLSLGSARFAIFSDLMQREKSSCWNGIPPLDILMVWHAFMLNPGAYSRFRKTVLNVAWIERGIDWNLLVSPYLKVP